MAQSKKIKIPSRKNASNVSPMEFSLKEVSTILAGGIPSKKNPKRPNLLSKLLKLMFLEKSLEMN